MNLFIEAPLPYKRGRIIDVTEHHCLNALMAFNRGLLIDNPLLNSYSEYWLYYLDGSQEILEMLEQTHLKAATAPEANISRERRLHFSGVKNFRDLGGYKTTDGRAVRWGVLYRSDSLHKLTTADLRHLSALCLDRIIDFRSTYEKSKEPDRLPEELPSRVIHIPILDSSTGLFQNSREEFVKIIQTVDATQYMIRTNVELATRFGPELRQFLDTLFSSNGRPVLFHCAAGKDRTGFAAAIVLRLLGVPQAVVMQDYLLTNQYFLASYRWTLKVSRLLKGRRFAESIKAFMIAQPAYLGSAFAAIDEKFGSFENYTQDGLGLTRTEMSQLRTLYLE
jgi:protein-tyrosine phosphatase